MKRVMLVAITGGSGSGKTFLAKRLGEYLKPDVTRLSQDTFYKDLSHLNASQRVRVNFDDPEAISWPEFTQVLTQLQAGKSAQVPVYDYKTHCRAPELQPLTPKPFILVDGLWLLLKPEVRNLFDLKIYIECPEETRFNRRLGRDTEARARDVESVHSQFQRCVRPMHALHVEPQRQFADLVLRGDFTCDDVAKLGGQLRDMQAKLR